MLSRLHEIGSPPGVRIFERVSGTRTLKNPYFSTTTHEVKAEEGNAIFRIKSAALTYHDPSHHQTQADL